MKFREKLSRILKEGIETSKDIVEKGASRVESMKLEHEAEKLCAKIGAQVYEILMEESQGTISKNTPEIKTLLQDLHAIEKRIDENEAE